MDGRMRKVVEPARVVEVEVRQHDVTDVARLGAEAPDLPHGRQLLAEVWAHEHQEEAAQPTAGIVHVLQAEAGVDEHEPGRRLEQQTMARELAALEERAAPAVHQPPAERTRRDAVQVMDAHALLFTEAPRTRSKLRATRLGQERLPSRDPSLKPACRGYRGASAHSGTSRSLTREPVAGCANARPAEWSRYPLCPGGAS